VRHDELHKIENKTENCRTDWSILLLKFWLPEGDHCRSKRNSL